MVEDEASTALVDGRRLRRRQDGGACGPTRTQIAVDGPFFALSNNKGNEIWGTEFFRIAKGTPGPVGTRRSGDRPVRRTRRDGRVTDKLGAKVAGFTVLGLVLSWWPSPGPCSTSTPATRRPATPRSRASASPACPRRRRSEKLRAKLAERTAEPIVVSYGDGRVARASTPAQAGISASTTRPRSRRRVAARGFGPRRIWALVTGGGDHHAEVAVDQSRMQATLDELGSGIGRRPVEGTVVFRDGTRRARARPAGHRRRARSPRRSCSSAGSCTAGRRSCRPRRKQPEVVRRGRATGDRRASASRRCRPPSRWCSRASGWSRPRGCSARASPMEAEGRRARAACGRRAAARGAGPGDAHGRSRARGRPDRRTHAASRVVVPGPGRCRDRSRSRWRTRLRRAPPYGGGRSDASS